MKCIRCGKDASHRERKGRICPQCKGRFAFEPQGGDPVTDQLFKNAIDAVSGGGRIRWGVEHLYYEVNRRKRIRRLPWPISLTMVLAGVCLVLAFVPYLDAAARDSLWFPREQVPFVCLGGGVLLYFGARSLLASPYVGISKPVFSELWLRWCEAHGVPTTLILRSPEIDARHKAARAGDAASVEYPVHDVPHEADIADYSFDRAVICDRARTVDLLLANNFHFENNCAILSSDGYPENVFETVRTMIKRNPRLHVFTLHDATPEGCVLATQIASSPHWFDGKTLVVDLGLRPRHGTPFDGLLLPETRPLVQLDGIDTEEAGWLGSNTLELAAIRPEDVLKRLFRGIQAHNNDDTSGGGTIICDSFDSQGGDSQEDSADGADSFG